MQAIVYSVTSDPNRIECSIEDHDSTVDLTVQINNKKDVVDIDKLTLHIPVGGTDNDGFALSTDKHLPEPIVESGEDQWKVTRDGSDVTIEPKPGAPIGLASTLTFKLPNIKVNKMPGNVPISFNETFPPKTGTLELVKVASTFLVSRFYVERNGTELDPPVLHDLDQRVKLKWDCTSAAEKNYSFSLKTTHGEAWQPKDCRNSSDCYSCRDGKDGVETDKLREDTTFALDVFKVEGESRTLTQTLFVTVDVVRPVIQNAEVGDTFFKGRVVSLHWLANNATSCDLQLGTQKINNLPTDTYDDGYLYPVAGGQQSFRSVVVAHGVGRASDSKDFYPDISVAALSVIDTGMQLSSLAITPDGRWALGSSGTNFVLIDVNASNARVLPYEWIGAFRELPTIISVAFTPDGNTALALILITRRETWLKKYTSGIVLIDMPAGTQRGPVIPIQDLQDFNPITDVPIVANASIAVTPDGKFALVANPPDEATVIDIAAHSVANDIPSPYPSAVAFTPNGTFGIVGTPTIKLITLPRGFMGLRPPPASWHFGSADIPHDPSMPLAIVSTANSQRAFVVNSDGGNVNNYRNVSVIDLDLFQGRKAATIQSTGSGPNSIALTTPTSQTPELAVVANRDGSLTVIRVDDVTAPPIHVPLDPGMQAGPIVISKTGGANNHGVGLIATDKNNVIRFDVDELPCRKSSSDLST